MDPRLLARLLAGGRILIGAALVAAPRTAGRRWLGDDADRAATEVVVRGLGGRDVAIGLGALAALEAGTPVRRWLEAGVLADLGDAAAMAVAGDDVPPASRLGTVAVAAGAAALGVWLTRALEERA